MECKETETLHQGLIIGVEHRKCFEAVNNFVLLLCILPNKTLFAKSQKKKKSNVSTLLAHVQSLWIITVLSLQRNIKLYGSNKLFSYLWEFSWVHQKKNKIQSATDILEKLNIDIFYCVLKEILATKENIVILKVFELLNWSWRPHTRDYRRQSWSLIVLRNMSINFALFFKESEAS